MAAVEKSGSGECELVLIAEDSPTQAEHLQWLLEEAGYEVAAAADGRRALALARQRRPSMVVSDVVMPGMDGYELCRAIKTDPELRDIPVILVTELSRPHDVFKGLNCGADNFVTKPYDERYLVARLRYLSSNRLLRATGRLQVGVEIELGGERHFITADRQQILDLLISTYDEAVHLNDELRDRQRELEASLQSLNGLANVTEALNRCTTVEQVLAEALSRTMALLEADAGWILLHDPERPEAPPTLAAAEGIQAADVPRQRGQLQVPVRLEERTLGSLNLRPAVPGEVERREIVTLTAIGLQVGVALERARLHAGLEQTVQARTAQLRQEVAERRRAQEQAQARSAQLAEVVRVGHFALGESDLQRLFDEVAGVVARTLDVPFCELLTHRPGDGTLLPQAGIGWPSGPADVAAQPAGADSLAGYALEANTPAIVADWALERRFLPPPHYGDNAIASSIAVPVFATAGPLGVLAAHAAARRDFDDDDTAFLVSMANIVSAAVARAAGVEALRRSEDEFRATFEQAPIGIAHVALDGTWRRVNDHLCRILGYTREEMLDRSFAELTHPDDRAASEVALGDLLREGAPSSVAEKRYLRKNGRDVWARVTTSVKRDEAGAPEYAIVIIEDITERREAQTQIAHLQRMEVVGRLTSGIAHDFNNLLTVVIGSLELLESAVQPGSAEAALVDSALDGANRGAELTRRLLTLARRQTLHPQVVDINTLVRGMTGLLQRSLGRGVALSVYETLQSARCLVDPSQLETALMNLCINAKDAMPANGSLIVTTDVHEFSAADTNQLNDLQPGHYVSISVADNGSGIPPEVLERIFEPYFTTKEPGKGTGLGLSIVYGFVKQSGGHVTVYSETNRGTTFRIYLPRQGVSEHAAVAAGPYGDSLPAASGSERILVVDDRPSLRSLMAAQLQGLGYDVAQAGNAAEALEEFERGGRVHLMVTDVTMPGELDGLALTSRVLESARNVPVIICSGFERHALGVPPAPGDRCVVLSKPYALAEVARAIRHLLDNRRSS